MSELAGDKTRRCHGGEDSNCVTVLAPTPRDAHYCTNILSEHGLAGETVSSIYETAQRIRSGTGVVLISQEFLTAEAIDELSLATRSQPSWSDIPILVLLVSTEMSNQLVTDLLSLGNVTLMDRPLRIALLVSTLKAKLRDRARQYEVRDLLHKAEEASRSKSAFVANMSHEIRTPMTSILGYAELMTNLVDNKEALKYLSTIRRNGDFLLRILNDILDLSKIEAEKLDIDIERFSLPPIIEDVRGVMEIRATEKGLKLEVEYVSDIPQYIESDSKRLRQILINLVGNAIKFTKTGGVKISVSFSPSHVDGSSAEGQLRFDITDSGIGITPEQQDRLFKPFSQGDSAITQQFGGTGLGLAISQRLATMLNGAICVNSTFDEGSTFTFTIATGDIKDIPLVSPRGRDPLARHAKPDADLRIDAHVLIVDDRRDIRFLSNRIVTMAGGRVAEAEDGLQAIETIRSASAQGSPFDIILLDMQMPNMDGYETATELRRLGYTLPIIALTADAMQGDMSKCLSAGCDQHISKPINRTELLQLMSELLSSRPHGQLVENKKD